MHLFHMMPWDWYRDDLSVADAKHILDTCQLERWEAERRAR